MKTEIDDYEIEFIVRKNIETSMGKRSVITCCITKYSDNFSAAIWQGNAVLNPEDKFDYWHGCEIALDRVFNVLDSMSAYNKIAEHLFRTYPKLMGTFAHVRIEKIYNKAQNFINNNNNDKSADSSRQPIPTGESTNFTSSDIPKDNLS